MIFAQVYNICTPYVRNYIIMQGGMHMYEISPTTICTSVVNMSKCIIFVVAIASYLVLSLPRGAKARHKDQGTQYS